jgi:hypothetical protein
MNNGPQSNGNKTRPGRSAHSRVRASGQGRVYQAGRDQHIETHHHHSAGRIAVVVTSVAAVALGIGLVVKFSADSKTGGAAEQHSTAPSITAQPGMNAASPSAKAPSESASGSMQSPSPQAGETLYSGKIRLTYVDLDSSPPSVLSSNTGASFWIHYNTTGDKREDEIYGLGGGWFTTKPTVAQWSEAAKPTPQQCSDLIATQGAETLPVSPGGRYCVKSAKGRIVAVTVGAFDETSGSYTGSITVWGAPS